MLRILCIAVTAFLVSSSSQAQTAFTAKWETGEKFICVISDKYTSKSTVGQQSFELQQSLTLDTTWEVKRISPNGGVELNVCIDRVRYTADGKGGAAVIRNLSFDSNAESEAKSKPEQSVADALNNYVGAVSAVSIDRRGRVTAFSLSDELSEKLKSAMTRELAGFFGNLFTPNGLRQRLTSWIVVFPAKPVSNGETWNQELPSRAGAEIVCIRNYTLVGAIISGADTVLQIDVTPELKTSDDAKWEVTDQQGDGVVYLDQQTHQIRDFVLRHHGRIMSFSDDTFNLVYSVKLRSAPR